MFYKDKILTCFLGFLFSAMTSISQYKLDQPVLIGKEQGLPTNDIRTIKKGKDGFMWIGTGEGLCRFDGQQVKKYGLQYQPLGSSFDNAVNAVLPLDKEVWMGTHQGLAILNISDESMRYYQLDEDGKSDSVTRRFNQSVTLLYQDRQGDTWLGTKDKGVWLYDKKKDDFRRFHYPPEAYKELIPTLGSITTTLSIIASKTNDSVIWVGTPSGLEEINKYSGKVNWYTFAHADKDYQVSLNAFRRLYHHDDGLLYVGSWGAGVNVFDPVKKTFTPLVLRDSPGNKVLTGPITNIQKHRGDDIWISTSQGLALYNVKQQAITWYQLNQTLRNEFYGIEYIDEANRIWHTTINGIQYFDPVMQQFSTHSYDQLFDKDWAYTFYIMPIGNGDKVIACPRVAEALFVFDKINNVWSRLEMNGMKAMGFERMIVRGFEEISPGQYIIAADEGMFSYSLATGKLSITPDQPRIPFKRWGEIKKDAAGNLWISADADGLVKWNIASKQFRLYKRELTRDRSGLGFGRPHHLFIDSKQNLWFARSDGFSVYISSKDSIVHFLYSENADNSFPAANNFSEDKNGRVWVSTGDGWYGYIDVNRPMDGVVKKFDLKEKNIAGFFTFLARDKEGNVWGYTYKELVRINAADMSLSTFSFAYGVKAVDFFHFSFLPSGEMIFGGRNSITLASPSELMRNKELPEPYIMQVNLLNQPVNGSTYHEASGLRLHHKQNFFTVFFSARAYTMPNGTRFRYRLKGFDDWVELSNSRLANYTNVPPGDYTFQLQAANNEGIWNEKMLELPIFIATPFWQTWWFKVMAILLIVGLVYWLYRYRISQVKKKEKLKTRYEKKLANVEMTALLAQMNPHFLFNSLNSIDSYIIKNESGKASEYLNNFARLMRLILQNSRSNYISLKDELETLDLYLQMEGLRFKDKFQYEIKVDEGIDTSNIVIPPMLIQPYVENAVWHGLMHKKDGTIGKAEIIISMRDNNLVCIVQDNGIGREKAQQLKEQKSGNHKRSMGMQITSDRIELINKLYNTNTKVEVVDLVDKGGNPTGTRVELSIPF